MLGFCYLPQAEQCDYMKTFLSLLARYYAHDVDIFFFILFSIHSFSPLYCHILVELVFGSDGWLTQDSFVELSISEQYKHLSPTVWEWSSQLNWLLKVVKHDHNNLCLKIVYFVRPKVQNSEKFFLLSHKTRTSSRFSHLRNWNKKTFDFFLLKKNDSNYQIQPIHYPANHCSSRMELKHH